MERVCALNDETQMRNSPHVTAEKSNERVKIKR